MDTNPTPAAETATAIVQAIEDAERSKKWTAEKAGIPITTFLRKCRGFGDFTVGEVARVAKALDRRPSDLLPQSFRDIAGEDVAA